jgi:hypothetical protein
VTTLIPFRYLFRLRMLGRRVRPPNRCVGRLPGEPEDGLLPGKLGFGTGSGYAGARHAGGYRPGLTARIACIQRADQRGTTYRSPEDYWLCATWPMWAIWEMDRPGSSAWRRTSVSYLFATMASQESAPELSAWTASERHPA